MRNSLVLKLMGAFLAVIAIGAVVISWTVSRATQSAFSLYTTRSSQVWAEQLAPGLAEFYANQGGWQGVDSYLQSSKDQLLTNLMESGGHMMSGNRQGPRAGMGFGRQTGAGMGMGGMMNPRLILADSQGLVIYDTLEKITGTSLGSAQLKAGAPVSVNGQAVATIIVSPEDLNGTSTPAGDFLNSVNRSILAAVLIAGAIALVLGAILFLQITAPLRKLKQAANAIAQGDLSQRVIITSKDEFGDLGNSFNQMAASLSQAENLRRHMIADIAHELRTPLSVIQANLEGMIDDVLPLDVEQVQSLYEQTAHLNRLVGDLRLLSLAEAGELHLVRQLVDLNPLIRKAVEYIQPQARQQGIELEVTIPEELPKVSIDSDRVTQVLNNLVSNALRYTPAGQSVIIQAGLADLPITGVQVSVIDPGQGINADDLPYIFDRFYRADKSRTRASGGSGLGLSIVKQLIEAHGGQVEAASPVYNRESGGGFGTRISFTLPLE